MAEVRGKALRLTCLWRSPVVLALTYLLVKQDTLTSILSRVQADVLCPTNWRQNIPFPTLGSFVNQAVSFFGQLLPSPSAHCLAFCGPHRETRLWSGQMRSSFFHLLYPTGESTQTPRGAGHQPCRVVGAPERRRWGKSRLDAGEGVG